MKMSIDTPYERKVYLRFDEGGADIHEHRLLLKERAKVIGCQALFYPFIKQKPIESSTLEN
jgi:hypothetical protein